MKDVYWFLWVTTRWVSQRWHVLDFVRWGVSGCLWRVDEDKDKEDTSNSDCIDYDNQSIKTMGFLLCLPDAVS